jgi:hypothetical protein
LHGSHGGVVRAEVGQQGIKQASEKLQLKAVFERRNWQGLV